MTFRDHGRAVFHAQHIVTLPQRVELQHPKDSVRRCSGASSTRARISLREYA